MKSSLVRLLVSLVTGYALHLAFEVHAQERPRAVAADAVADLRTRAGLEAVGGSWRYHDTHLHPIAHRWVGPDLKATGATNVTFDFEPDARAVDFDDSAWQVLDPTSLEARRGPGKLSMGWYRLRLRIPDRVGHLETRGSTVTLELVVDDYAETWINGGLPLVPGLTGGPTPAGWNAPNRMVLTRDATPGTSFTLAILAINGPLSAHPDTYVWIRSATLEFHAPGRLNSAQEVPLVVDRRDRDLDRILPAQPRLERLASGFTFTEGPVWVPGTPGHLLFSDPNQNLIYRLTAHADVYPFLPKSGYTGLDIGRYRQPGSNGLALDAEQRLTLCQHGNRRVVRLEPNGLTTVLADRFEGRRLNSPNDLVYARDGTLFFSDPPFGLPDGFQDPAREIPFSGVYAWRNGTLRLVTRELTGPNGLALSPNEDWLYVGNWDEKRKTITRHRLHPDGSFGPGERFCDLTSESGDDAIDGLEVDRHGHVYACGPGGLWILHPDGRILGLLRGPEAPHNLAWGDADGRSLYLAAMTGIYRLRLDAAGPGVRPLATAQR